MSCLALVLAGCSGKSSDGSSGSNGSDGSAGGSAGLGGASGSGGAGGSGTAGGSGAATTSQGAGSTDPFGKANHAPTGKLNLSVVKGTAPLKVNITITAADLDKDNVTYSLTYGDSTTTPALGKGPYPVKLSHNYTTAKVYTLNLTLRDGKTSTTYFAAVNVTSAPTTGPGNGEKTDYSCNVAYGMPGTQITGFPGGNIGGCDLTTTSAASILRSATIDPDCTLNAAVGTEYPSGKKFTMTCGSPGTTDMTGTITLQD